ncbi:hypothetical protein FGO68_gene12663 [Halteria grandinella]|uniref:Uncharacterized protein n=1 Tax=Halteria grandinella TaxID=5974 RepID=A0A8J8NS09_HALGN|nr:hypothetical protein FGO68_gene12663 [Halteria grandinella]
MNHQQIYQTPIYQESPLCRLNLPDNQNLMDKMLCLKTPDSSNQNFQVIGQIESTNAFQCNIAASSFMNMVSATNPQKRRDSCMANDQSQIIKRDANTLNICHKKFQFMNKELQIWTPNNTLIKGHQQKKTKFQESRYCSVFSKFNHQRILSQGHNPILDMENLIISRQLRDKNLLIN